MSQKIKKALHLPLNTLASLCVAGQSPASIPATIKMKYSRIFGHENSTSERTNRSGYLHIHLPKA